MNTNFKTSFLFGAFLLITVELLAANFYTQSGGNGLWNSTTNWVGGLKTGNNAGASKWSAPNDTVFIDHAIYTNQNFQLGGANLIVVIRTGGSLSITTSKNLTVNNSTIIVDGGTLNVTNNFTTSNPSPIIIRNNSTVNVTNDMTINNTALSIEAGSTLNVGGAFSTSNTSGSVINVGGHMNVGNGMSKIAGTWNIASTGSLDVTGNLTNDTGGITFNVDGDVAVSGNTSFHSGNFNIGSGGSFASSGSGQIVFGSANIINNGVMNFPNATSQNKWGGTFDCDGSSGTGTVGFGSGDFCGGVCASGSGGSCVDFGVPLPIELRYFAVSIENNDFVFSWETAMEKNNDFFTIEYSFDLETFFVLLDKPSKGTSYSPTSYQESAPVFTFESIIYFRLKQTDYDGAHSYSQIVAVGSISQFDSELKIYPNPTSGNTLIQLAEINEELQTAYIFSSSTLTKVGEVEIEQGEVVVDLSYLENGVYFVKVGDLGNAVFKLVIQK